MRSPQDFPHELLKIENNRYYILASSSYTDDQTRELNYGDTFAIFDRWGDFKQLGLGVQGLYYAGTRYISDIEFRVNGFRPVLLSSMVKNENDKFSIDLSNPRMEFPDHDLVEKGTVHILRNKFLTSDGCFEHIQLQNFDVKPVRFYCTLSFAGDFSDIFEIRGMTRMKRGTLLEPAVDQEDRLRLGYHGLDGVQREAVIAFDHDVSWKSSGLAELEIALEPGARTLIGYSIYCHEGTLSPNGNVSYQQAWAAVSKEREEKDALLGKIFSDSDQFNAWIRRSRNDLLGLLSKTSQGYYPYAGVPWYNTPFGRDGIITALESLWLAPDIAKGVLKYLAATQATKEDAYSDAEPGKILHEARGGEMAELREVPFKQYYGTIDATPLFVVLAGQYYKRTGDKETIQHLWKHITKALQWIETYGDADRDGFVEYQQKMKTGLRNQGWKDSEDSVSHANGALATPSIALCEVQAYVYEAYIQAAYLANALEQKVEAAAYKVKARQLKRLFNDVFWDGPLGTYVMALDGDKKPCRIRTSNAGHCLFSGIADRSKAARLAASLMKSDLFSGWGIRTLSSAERRYNPMSYHNGSVWPHDTALIAAGLARYGFTGEALALTKALFAASLHFEEEGLPELFCGFAKDGAESPTSYPVACSPQAWSVAAVFLLLQACLQMEIDAPRKRVRFTRPRLPDFIGNMRIADLQVPQGTFTFDFKQYKDDLGIIVVTKPAGWDVIIQR